MGNWKGCIKACDGFFIEGTAQINIIDMKKWSYFAGTLPQVLFLSTKSLTLLQDMIKDEDCSGDIDMEAVSLFCDGYYLGLPSIIGSTCETL